MFRFPATPHYHSMDIPRAVKVLTGKVIGYSPCSASVHPLSHGRKLMGQPVTAKRVRARRLAGKSDLGRKTLGKEKTHLKLPKNSNRLTPS